jgi:hypothetical protein
MNSKHKVFWPVAFLVGGLFVTSCYYDDYQTLYGTGGACDTAAVSYSTDIQPLMSSQCTGCHGAVGGSGGLSLATHAQVAAAVNQGSLLNRVHLAAGNPLAMPPSGPLTSCQKAKLRTWKRQGALNN